MPITFACTGCRKKLQVREEGAGKRIKCPACGAALTVPAAPVPAAAPAATPAAAPAAKPVPADATASVIPFAPVEQKPATAPILPPAPPAPAAADSDEAPTEKPRRRKRKKRGGIEWTEPLFVLAGIHFTPIKLAIVVPLLGLLGWLSYGPVLRLSGGIRPDVQVVDAWLAVPYVPKLSAASTDMRPDPPDRQKLLVTRPKAEGKFLLVSFSIPQKMLDNRFGDKVMIALLTSADVKLDGPTPDGIAPLFLLGGHHSEGFTVSLPKAPDDHPDPKNYFPEGFPLGPFSNAPWQTDGELQEAGDGQAQFRGKDGLEVHFLRKRGPKPKIDVTWDSKSTGWLAAERAPNPNQILGGWEVTCLFPRPANAGKVTLRVLGQSIELDVP